MKENIFWVLNHGVDKVVDSALKFASRRKVEVEQCPYCRGYGPPNHCLKCGAMYVICWTGKYLWQ